MSKDPPAARGYTPLPPPSRLDLGPERLPGAPPAFAIRMALGLRRALLRLADRVVPAEIALLESCVGVARTELLAALARHNVVDALGDEALTADEIARRTGLHAGVLHRTLRALAAFDFFEADTQGRFRNNRLSRALRSGTTTRGREAALYFGSPSHVAAWVDFEKSLQSGESSFERVHGVDVWKWFDQHPDEREIFAHTMMGFTVMSASTIAALYPFKEIATLCDVGGGRGTLMSELLLRHGHLRGILADAPGVLDSARALLSQRGVLDRVQLTPSSFFDRVPEGADAYLLKNVLHDWDDATCERILRVVHQAAAPGARLLICESLVEHLDDTFASFVDLQMLVACKNGRERGVEEFRSLLARSGFRLDRVFRFPTISILEALPTG